MGQRKSLQQTSFSLEASWARMWKYLEPITPKMGAMGEQKSLPRREFLKKTVGAAGALAQVTSIPGQLNTDAVEVIRSHPPMRGRGVEEAIGSLASLPIANSL